MKEQTNNPVPNFFLASAENFKKIPGSPIAYWVSDKVRRLFDSDMKLSKIGRPRQGLASTNNDFFYRLWHEIDTRRIGFSISSKDEAIETGYKWFPLNKGGAFRRWAGNSEYIINFENDGKTICDYIDNTPGARVGSNGRVINRDFYYKLGITYSDLTTGGFGARYFGQGFIFDTTGPSIFDENGYGLKKLLAYVNTKIFQTILDTVCTGLHYSNGVLAGLPVHFPKEHDAEVIDNTEKLITKFRIDWDSYEINWDFTSLPLLHHDYRQPTLKETYAKLYDHWSEMILEMQRLEEENNRIFIGSYSLQDELTPEIPLNKITLICNPHYRYNGNKTENELEDLLLADTMKEFISYAVGCMFGRYSLDKTGLILANQGETIEDYKKKVPNPTFEPDSDNVIPILDGDWFIDDIADRFRGFLRVTFGEEHYNENLKFMEQAIGKDIRRYFLKDFYNHHVKMYKKRPIYWMFSSPNGSFNALIYMHRYRPDTVSIVLNNYLREFRSKIAAKKENLEEISSSPSSSQSDKAKALKEIEKLKKVITELEEYERDILYPLATQQIEIELDDGVKVNYDKFGKALRKIPGLTGK